MTTPDHDRPSLVWHSGVIRPVCDVSIPLTDRTFEHGLGLFETMRGVRLNVPLWHLHRQRLIASAQALGLGIDETRLPALDDLCKLIHASGLGDESSRLRLVLTGGSADAPGTVFVTARPLEPAKTEGLRLAADFWPVDHRDPLIRHKSLNYWARRVAHERAAATGADDALSQDQSGNLWESARSALFLVAGGRWIAPPADGPRLASVADQAIADLLSAPGQRGLERRTVTPELLAEADEVVLANAVRGPMSVATWGDRRFHDTGPAFVALRELWRSTYF